jgi:hypothetical protein
MEKDKVNWSWELRVGFLENVKLKFHLEITKVEGRKWA